MNAPTREEFEKYRAKYAHELEHDPFYRIATHLINEAWPEPSGLVDGISVFLFTWHQAFYRYGAYDYCALRKCLKVHFENIAGFRSRDIASLSVDDGPPIKELFGALYQALKIVHTRPGSKAYGRRSPIATGKALHLLAPRLFPLWDSAIAQGYECDYSAAPAEAYVSFCVQTRELAQVVVHYDLPSDRPLPKMIDEYNYAKWVIERKEKPQQ